MPAPANPIAWANDTTWTSGSRSGEDTKIDPPPGVAEQGHVGDETFKAEYANAAMNNYYLWLEYLRGEVGRDQFGDGSDGTVTIPAGTTTLTRDMYYDNLTILAGRFLRTAGYRVFVRNTLTIAATGGIHNDGTAGPDGDGTGNPGGAGAPDGSLIGGQQGGTSQVFNDGGAGGDVTSMSLGGDGGDGGDGSDGQNGGAGGVVTPPDAQAGGWRHLDAALGYLTSAAGVQAITGGAGGGAGGGGDSGDGGSGGGGAGVLVVWARIIANAGFIRSHGGDGGDAYTGPDAAGNGGGGGGGGGPVFLVCRQYSGAGTVTSAGGGGGAGFGTGADGEDGDGGEVLRMIA